MMTPYELGYKKGQWNKKELKDSGWGVDARGCLENIEKVYAADEGEFYDGLRQAARDSLEPIIEEQSKKPWWHVW
jgi:hypothetical protein